jgi:hypothetical protein
MGRLVAIALLIVVGFGAVWCVDGCVDPATGHDAPSQSSEASTCIVCVVPFTTSPSVVATREIATARVPADLPIAHLWVTPTFSIEHPPRII